MHGLLAAALLALPSPPGLPQPPEAASEPAPERDGARVYRLQLEMDVPVIAASALVALVPNLLASSIIQRSCPCDPSGLWPVDRGAVGNESHSADVASTVTEVLAVVVPPLLDLADVGPTTAWAEDAVVFGETLLVNEALLTAVKYAVQRPRPFLYAHPELASDPEGYLSFYSGHTSATFAALAATAFTMRLRHGERVWPWLVAAAVGASVAVERVAAGQHFPTDVAAGAVAGIAVGLAVPWLHAAPRGAARLSLAPATLGRGLALAGAF